MYVEKFHLDLVFISLKGPLHFKGPYDFFFKPEVFGFILNVMKSRLSSKTLLPFGFEQLPDFVKKLTLENMLIFTIFVYFLGLFWSLIHVRPNDFLRSLHVFGFLSGWSKWKLFNHLFYIVQI
jgi:hypothetical protein